MTKYKVIGPTSVFGNEPGTVFEAQIPKRQSDRLKASGHLEIVIDEPKPKPKAKAENVAKSNDDTNN